jgi:hypothetical protein
MLTGAPSSKAGTDRPSVSPWAQNRLWILTALGLFVWLSLLAFWLPYDADESVYRIVASGMLDGKWPYRDLFDHKPPLIYVWYLPGAAAHSLHVERVIASACVAASVVSLAILARRWLLSEGQARFAVLSYVAFLVNPWLAVQTNAEAFLLPLILGSLAVPSPLVGGMLLGLAVMTKYTAVAFLPVMVLTWGRASWRVGVGLGVVCGVVMVPLIPVFADFWDATARFNSEYGRYSYTQYGSRIVLSIVALNTTAVLSSLPLWLAAVLSLRHRAPTIALVFGACGLLAVKSEGFNSLHSHALLVAPASLLAARSLDRVYGSGFCRVYRIR